MYEEETDSILNETFNETHEYFRRVHEAALDRKNEIEEYDRLKQIIKESVSKLQRSIPELNRNIESFNSLGRKIRSYNTEDFEKLKKDVIHSAERIMNQTGKKTFEHKTKDELSRYMNNMKLKTLNGHQNISQIECSNIQNLKNI